MPVDPHNPAVATVERKGRTVRLSLICPDAATAIELFELLLKEARRAGVVSIRVEEGEES